jgi:hypothetical protein
MVYGLCGQLCICYFRILPWSLNMFAMFARARAPAPVDGHLRKARAIG